jgi:hypothetical protein
MKVTWYTRHSYRRARQQYQPPACALRLVFVSPSPNHDWLILVTCVTVSLTRCSPLKFTPTIAIDTNSPVAEAGGVAWASPQSGEWSQLPTWPHAPFREISVGDGV